MNMNNLIQQAQKMQKDLEKKQNEIKDKVYTESSELVDVILYGSKKVKEVKFKNIDNLTQDDLEILQDMIKIATNNAITQIEKDMDNAMGPYAKQFGGLF